MRTKDFLFFDLDGTLVESNLHHEVAFKKALANDYPELANCFNYEIMKGKKTQDVFIELNINNKEQLARLTEAKQRYYRQAIKNGEISLYSSARVLLEYCKSIGKKLYLLTGSSRQSAYSVLESCKIIGFFEGIITSEDVKLNKPNPDIFLLGLSRFNLQPHRTLTIEDSLNGVEASQKAGIDVVLVNNPKTLNNVTCFRSLRNFYLFVRKQYEELNE
jgi:HAD superfamily hydrolase (TIGR01509 family)